MTPADVEADRKDGTPWMTRDIWDALVNRAADLVKERDAATERAERAEAELREACMQSLADMGQAQDAYDAQLKAEARAERLRAALRKIASHPAKSYFHEVTATDGQKTKTVQTERVVSEVDVVAMMDIARAAIAADTQEADHE